MKSKPPSYEKQIEMLKQTQRRQEIEQKLTSMRFSQQLKNIVSEEYQFRDRELVNKVDQQGLEKLLNDHNIDQIYRVIMCSDFQTTKIIENYSQRLIQLFLETINMPQAIISLTNLIKKSQLASLVLYEMKRFDLVIDCLKKNSTNSCQQNVYLVCISEILQLKDQYLKTVNHEPLLVQIEMIFKRSLQRQAEDNVVITIIKTLFQECSPNLISEAFLSAVISHFWTAKRIGNIANLYITAGIAIQRQLYRQSLTIILNLVQIIIKGRHRLQSALQNKVKPILQILTTLFINYNGNWSEIGDTGQLDVEGNGKTIKIGLHDFFLIYQTNIFWAAQIDLKYCTFLRQFSKNCDGESIFKVLNENGMISNLINEMQSSPDICEIILKTFFVIIFKDNSSEVKEAIISTMKYSEIQKSISLCMINFQNNQQLQGLAFNLLSLLVIKQK